MFSPELAKIKTLTAHVGDFIMKLSGVVFVYADEWASILRGKDSNIKSHKNSLGV